MIFQRRSQGYDGVLKLGDIPRARPRPVIEGLVAQAFLRFRLLPQMPDRRVQLGHLGLGG
jgi:hypothetical protein